MTPHASQSIYLCDWLLMQKYLFIHFTDYKLHFLWRSRSINFDILLHFTINAENVNMTGKTLRGKRLTWSIHTSLNSWTSIHPLPLLWYVFKIQSVIFTAQLCWSLFTREDGCISLIKSLLSRTCSWFSKVLPVRQSIVPQMDRWLIYFLDNYQEQSKAFDVCQKRKQFTKIWVHRECVHYQWGIFQKAWIH